MRRTRLMGVVAGALFAVALWSVAMSAEASAAVTTPGPPTAVHATSIAGVSGTTVSWEPPVSNGGSPILYYLASTYTGGHFCVSFTSGPGTCHIDALKIGVTRPSIRVRAVSARGRGAVVVTIPVVAHQDPASSAVSVSTPSPTSSAGSQPTSDVAGASSAGSVSGAGDPTELPTTGLSVEALFILGASLVFCGSLVLSPLGRRRRADANTADWLLQR
jgi:hypothetical protein